jgi:hypothetical protein
VDSLPRSERRQTIDLIFRQSRIQQPGFTKL